MMIYDWHYRTLNLKSVNRLCGCEVSRRTNRCKIEQWFKVIQGVHKVPADTVSKILCEVNSQNI